MTARLCRALVLTAVLLVYAVPARAQDLPAPVPCAGCSKPKLKTSWQIQFQGRVETAVQARFCDVDSYERASTVRALHRRGRMVVCYINAGAWENFRTDKDAYPEEVLGKRYAGFPEERWVDVRRIDLLAPILRARIDDCKSKGFDGVDPDNLNGLENDTGFPLTEDDQLRFNAWFANEVHARGLSVGLKNDGPEARQLEPHFDWVIVEECIQQRLCGQYAPFVRAGKPVFEIEYRKPTRRACSEARRRQINVVFKTPALRASRRTCADVR